MCASVYVCVCPTSQELLDKEKQLLTKIEIFVVIVTDYGDVQFA